MADADDTLPRCHRSLGGFALKLKIKPNAAISITILTPLLSNRQMLPWTELLENEHLFHVLPAVSSGRELIEFLNNQVEPPSNLTFFYQELKEGGCLSASGRGFAGMYHCIAYIASLLTSEHVVKDFKEGLDMPDIEGICQIDKVLEIFKANHFFMHHLNLC